jgi:hypothetical protein
MISVRLCYLPVNPECLLHTESLYVHMGSFRWQVFSFQFRGNYHGYRTHLTSIHWNWILNVSDLQRTEFLVTSSHVVGIQVLKALFMKSSATFWGVMPCSSLKFNPLFRGIFCIQSQGRRLSQPRNQREHFHNIFGPGYGGDIFTPKMIDFGLTAPHYITATCFLLGWFSTLTMEVIYLFETSIRIQMEKMTDIRKYCCEICKSFTVYFLVLTLNSIYS